MIVGGVVISMAKRSKSPARLFYLSIPNPVLLLRENDLVFWRQKREIAQPWAMGTEV
jgi:hypothetical protein